MYLDENGQLGMRAIQLEMTTTPGIASSDMHRHALTLEFPDADHVTERWTNYANGNPAKRWSSR